MQSEIDQLVEMGWTKEFACGKRLSSTEDIQMHSARTGHSDFKESDVPYVHPSAEEKQAEMLRLQEQIKLQKFRNEEAERRKNIEDEKHRRQQGKVLLSAKAKFQEEEMKRNAEQLRKERAEDKAYREKLRAEIARDRANRVAHQSPLLPALSTAVPQTLTTSPNSGTPSDVTECRLQIRTPTGQPLKCTFQSSDNLEVVAQFVGRNWPADSSGVSPTIVDCQEITLQTAFPSRKFCVDDFPKTLKQLGLCPSAVLMAQRRSPP
ncbi:unnamed protein product [Mesocestoides corti]|uniref:UBX domain-containing protein n=1 Tax=Mesocestoides corti TaxID=53468 RepID=A0A158QTG1_MESCO|nr:unnamed protein product [Mesocestoides corti]